MLELYIFLFIDSFFATLILPIRSEMIFPATILFEGYDKLTITIIAIMASISGLIVNYFIGRCFIFVKKTPAFLDKQKELEKIDNFWNKYLIFLAPIMVLNSVGNVFSLFCGFFKSKFNLFLTLILIGKFIYYIYLVVGSV